jgi:hypothetical protein
VTKLRYDCLRAANARDPKADPQQVVHEANKNFEFGVRFILGKSS